MRRQRWMPRVQAEKNNRRNRRREKASDTRKKRYAEKRFCISFFAIWDRVKCNRGRSFLQTYTSPMKGQNERKEKYEISGTGELSDGVSAPRGGSS